MTQASSPALGFAFAIQTAKSSPVTDLADFHRMRVVTANIGNQQAMERLPQEVGGGYHTGGSFKTFVAGAGQVRALARLENDIGYLLWALLGAPEASGTSAVDGYKTTFKPVDDFCAHPWMSVRKMIPSCESNDYYLGESLTDAKLSTMQFTLAPGAPGIMDLSMLSIGAAFSEASDAITWEAGMEAYENTESVIMPTVAGAGVILSALTGVDLGGGEATAYSVPSVAMQFGIQNRLSGDGVRPELIIGQLGMDDNVLVGQEMVFSATYKWRDPSLYKAVYARTATGVGSQPTSTVLRDEVTIRLRSPRTWNSLPEQLEVVLTNCTLECPGGIQLTGGEFVTAQIVGRAELQATPSAYATINLRNGTAYPGVAYTAGSI